MKEIENILKLDDLTFWKQIKNMIFHCLTCTALKQKYYPISLTLCNWVPVVMAWLGIVDSSHDQERVTPSISCDSTVFTLSLPVMF